MSTYPVNRDCPITGESAHRVLGFVSAKDVCQANETYRAEYAEILGIHPDDEFPIAQSDVSGCVYAGWCPPSDFLTNVYENLVDHTTTITATMAYRSHLCRFSSQVFESLLSRFAPLHKPLTAMDYGCGYGTLLDLLSCRDLSIVGFEPSSDRRNEATTKGNGIFSDRNEVAKMAPFDLIVCTEVLEHLADPLEALEFMRAKAHNRTLLAVTVPHCSAEFVTKSIAKKSASGLPRVIQSLGTSQLFYSDDTFTVAGKGGISPGRRHGTSIWSAFLAGRNRVVTLPERRWNRKTVDVVRVPAYDRIDL